MSLRQPPRRAHAAGHAATRRFAAGSGRPQCRRPAPVPAPEPRIDFELRFPAERGGGKAAGTAATIEYQRDDFADLSGNVDIKYQDFDLKADAVVRRPEEEGASRPLGHVVIDQGPRRMTGDKATFDLETKTGTLEQRHGLCRARLLLQRLDDRARPAKTPTRSRRASSPPASGESPAWSFRVSHADLRVEGYAHAEERGDAGEEGARALPAVPGLAGEARPQLAGCWCRTSATPTAAAAISGSRYYQVLGRSFDTTFLVDGYEKGYYGVGDELRYQPTAGTKGTVPRLRGARPRDRLGALEGAARPGDHRPAVRPARA